MSNSAGYTLTLREDKSYCVDFLVNMVSQRFSVSRSQAKQIVEELFDKMKEVINAISRIRREGYRILGGNHKVGKIEIEASPPYIEEDIINFGQWVGIYKIYSNVLGEDLFIFIEPKIEVKYYEKMLFEVWEYAVTYGPQFINYVFNNIFGLSSYYIDAIYSYLVSILSQLALFEGLPRVFIKEKKLTNIPLGLSLIHI